MQSPPKTSAPLTRLEPGSFDLLFIAQTLHHFTPGQLARVIAESYRIAKVGFVGVDVRRSLLAYAVLGPVCLFGALSGGSWQFAHDTAVSITTMYSEPELALIAERAAPQGILSIERTLPIHSCLKLLHP